MEIKQYHILLVNLDPTVGSEIKKNRPCLVISPDEMNKYLKTIIIAPITSSTKDYPTRIKILLGKIICWIAIDQVRTIDKLSVLKILGALDQKEIKKVKAIIKETFVD